MKKSKAAAEVVASYGGALHGGTKNLSFEHQGDGTATLGKANQDEFYREIGQLRVKATVTTAADLVQSTICE
jgi:hypothetical protein